MFIEDKVESILKTLTKFNINLNIEEVSDLLDIFVVYNEYLSCYMQRKGHDVIYIKQSDEQTMWRSFTHELGHYFLHSTNQHIMPDMFNEKQEHEANKFSLLFRMPKDIIIENELYDERSLIAYFNEDYESARNRLKLLFNQMTGDVVW